MAKAEVVRVLRGELSELKRKRIKLDRDIRAIEYAIESINAPADKPVKAARKERGPRTPIKERAERVLEFLRTEGPHTVFITAGKTGQPKSSTLKAVQQLLDEKRVTTDGDPKHVVQADTITYKPVRVKAGY